MSGLAEGNPMTAAIKSLYAPIEEELARTEELLRAEMRSSDPYVDELVRYGCLLGGKRLRPALLLLGGKAVGVLDEGHCLLAAVMEMIHTATLVHDDVLDEADHRRHLATINSRWDDEASVLLGDFLFSHAFYLASTLESTLACQWIGRATNIVCEGELRQKGSRGDYLLDERRYLSIIESKTAELCDCSCRLGAHRSGASTAVTRNLADYGRDLGIAFQIADDLLDVVGDEQSTGKSLGTDIEQQKPTMPVIHALEHAGAAERSRLLDILHHGDASRRDELIELLRRLGSLDYTRRRALSFAQRAKGRLRDLDPSPALTVLETLADFVVERKF